MKAFKETQRFDQWWMRIFLLIALAIAASPLVFDFDIQINSKTAMVSIIISMVIILSVFLGFWFLFKLETSMDQQGVSYRFFPFHMKPRTQNWSEIDTIQVRKYKPLREYGGWGYRITLRKNKALTTKGNLGIQIVFKNGNELLLGTQRPEEARKAIAHFKPN